MRAEDDPRTAAVLHLKVLSRIAIIEAQRIDREQDCAIDDEALHLIEFHLTRAKAAIGDLR